MTPPSEVALRLTERVRTAETALSTYADRLAELDAQRRTLVTDLLAFDQDRASTQAENADNTTWDSITDHFQREAILSARREDALHDRVVALQVAKDRAEIECANAIGDMWGMPDYHLGGETSVLNPYRYGSTADGYDALARSGKAAWNHPASWTGGPWQVKLDRLDRGGQDALVGIKDSAFDLAGLHGDGRAQASRSGLRQFGSDVWTYTSWDGYTNASDEQRQASLGRLKQAGQSSIGYGTWSHDGWHTAGSFLPDIVATTATGGAFAAPRTAGRAALASRLPAGVQLNPAALAPVVRSRSAEQLGRVQIGLSNWLDTHLPAVESRGSRPAVAGVAPPARPQDTPPPSLWAMDTGGHAKGSASAAAQSTPSTVAGHHVPPINWGTHAEVSSEYAPQTRAAVASIIDKAIAAEPAVTRDYLAALPDGTRAHGLEHRIKSPDSLASKLQRQEEKGSLETPARMPTDVLRYTSVVDLDSDLVTSAHAIVDDLRRDGWTVTKAHHSYVAGNRYKGIHSTLTSPNNGTPVELQFHSKSSIDVKDRTHESYEIVRDENRPMSERLEAERWAQSLTESLAQPAGIDELAHLGGVPVAIKIYPPSDW